MTGTPPSDEPDRDSPSLRRRRKYFEDLTQILISSGVDGDLVGRMVAELDDHVAMSGNDPVDELGRVGELATALLESSGSGRFGRQLVGSLVFGLTSGVAMMTTMALRSDVGPDGHVIHIGSAVSLAVSVAGMSLLRGIGAPSVRARRSTVGPSTSAILAFILVLGATAYLQAVLRWEVSTPGAVILLALSLPAAAASGWWWVRRWRVPVPGDAPHLRGLGWSWFGR